ncbi:MAG: ATP-binding protein [Terriglobales bacterium]
MGGIYMQDFFPRLPSVLFLGALVAVFVALHRRNRSPRVRYWLAGWGLMFLHFFVTLLTGPSRYHPLETFLELATLQMTGVAFWLSVSGCIGNRRSLQWLGLFFLAPVTVYSALLAGHVEWRWPYLACLVLFVYPGAIWGAYCQRARWWLQVLPLGAASLGTWAIYRVLRGEFTVGFQVFLLITFTVTAALFVRRHPRATPGVITAAAGFIGWAGIWAVDLFGSSLIARIGAGSELWNLPKYFVAMGMILTLLEEESHAAQLASQRERAAVVQLERFADVTSRLLSGVEVESFCGHIAEVITEATTFMRVAILLRTEGDRLQLAGHAGIAEADLRHITASVANASASAAAQLCQRGRLIGKTAVILAAKQMEGFNPAKSTRSYAPNPNWEDGDELIVPLISPRGMFVGMISLDDPRDPECVTAEEMAKIEMLAADLAVAIDNAALHRQVVMGEKLAGLGQLVSGMAHEINNPLTAILGYSELLADCRNDAEIRRGLGIIHREAQRMKSIVGNLLRFAQQDRVERASLNVLALLREVLQTKAFEARSRGIELVDNLASSLPPVRGNESQLKQVFVNVLNNAFEALENAVEKRVTVIARAETAHVSITVLDTGPGFKDLDRIFDPFFTTKSPGKGTGLGLSICYGVLKQHGGNITARNVQPAGACITIELPAAKEQAAAASESVVH